MRLAILLIILLHVSAFAFAAENQRMGIEDLQGLRSQALELNISNESIDLLFSEFIELQDEIKNKRYVTLIDYNRPSTEKRMFIFDLKNRQIESYLVAHGKASGVKFAEAFSNQLNSNMTSLGFFKTGGTYVSEKVGPALKLYGLEAINNRAWERGIVIHGAWYVDEKVVAENGRLGRSLGCPAVDPDYTDKIIQRLKGGSLVLGFHRQLVDNSAAKQSAPSRVNDGATSTIDQIN